jgi:hypothetical protein
MIFVSLENPTWNIVCVDRKSKIATSNPYTEIVVLTINHETSHQIKIAKKTHHLESVINTKGSSNVINQDILRVNSDCSDF